MYTPNTERKDHNCMCREAEYFLESLKKERKIDVGVKSVKMIKPRKQIIRMMVL